MSIPQLLSDRLQLRGFRMDDARRVQQLAGDFKIADMTLNIPHPYEDGMAEAWIATHAADFEEKKRVAFAICEKDSEMLVGAVSLMNLLPVHNNAELGYWIGVPYWNRGYATEAAQRVLEYAFSDLGLHRIYAHHLSRNPASGKVLRKIGMSHEGTFRDHIFKWDRFEDIECYGILRKDHLRNWIFSE